MVFKEHFGAAIMNLAFVGLFCSLGSHIKILKCVKIRILKCVKIMFTKNTNQTIIGHIYLRFICFRSTCVISP